MPIEIKITDIYALTLREIDDLNMYLMNCQIKPVDSEVAIKTRKKREKPITEGDVTWSTTPSLSVPDGIPVDVRQDVTYQELISYVLENTRTKQLDYSRVMDILKVFEVPNLNALENTPHLISAIYQSVKEITR